MHQSAVYIQTTSSTNTGTVAQFTTVTLFTENRKYF